MRTRRMVLALAAAAGSLAGGPAAHATALTASQILANFNLVTTGNASTQSDIEGSAVIGGNLSGATFFNNDVPASPSIYLYGKQSGNTNLDAGGKLYANGAASVTGSVNYNGGGGLVSSGPPNPLTTYTTPLTQLSTTLNGLATTAGDSVSSQSNALTFNALAAGINVFTLTASQLSADMSNTSIYFNIAAGATSVIINVDGTGTFQESGGVNWNGSPLEDVLFNFVGFSSVSVGNWQSSILAPGAAVSIENGYIAGSVFAASFNGGGELHNDPFDGALPSDPPADPPSTTVPEPMSVLMLGTGLAGLALVLWRRPRRVAARA